jgi:aerotaxis receptor
MRKNLPVTNQEYVLLDGLSIVSKTDTKGRITYVNPYFIEVSGFAEEELLGAPHNLVRHPDMPQAAFADLWETLQQGMSWTGLVKNRRKNGDFYWVVANVTPVREGSQTVDYMSVRTKPTHQQIEAAEQAYGAIRNGTAKGIAIARGAVVPTGLRGKIEALRHMPLSLRMWLGMSAMNTGVIALGASAWVTHQGDAAAWIAGGTAACVAIGVALWYMIHSTVVRPLDAARSTTPLPTWTKSRSKTPRWSNKRPPPLTSSTKKRCASNNRSPYSSSTARACSNPARRWPA